MEATMEQQRPQEQQQQPRPGQQPPNIPVGSAAEYYNSTSLVPAPGAAVPMAPGPLPVHGGPPSSVGAGQLQHQHQHQQPSFGPPPMQPVSPRPMQQPQQQHQQQYYPQPGSLTQSPGPIVATTTAQGLKGARLTAESALREYMALQHRRYYAHDGADLGPRVKLQADVVVSELFRLRSRVADVVKAAEQHRWRRWLIGGIVGTIIPMVKTLFRRPPASREAANSTEYAFWRSKSLLGRIMNSVKGMGGLASVTFFVFSVLYVFQNEVSLRIAKTMGKRLRRLTHKIDGAHPLDERDVALLSGWRWRVLDVHNS